MTRFGELRSDAHMDSDERFQILKQELVESRHRSEVMGRALDAILSKLNINLNEQKIGGDSTFRKDLLRHEPEITITEGALRQVSEVCERYITQRGSVGTWTGLGFNVCVVPTLTFCPCISERGTN